MSQMIELRLLCEEMRKLEQTKEELEAKLKVVNGDLDFIRLKKIPDFMQSNGIQNAKFEGLGRVQLASDLYANTREGQKDAAMQWLRDLGYEGMISETYNASTLKALFRRMMVEGKPIPEEIFNVTPFIRASIVKG